METLIYKIGTLNYKLIFKISNLLDFSAKYVYKMLSKIHSQIVLERDEVIDVKECVQKLSSNGSNIASTGLESTHALLTSTTYPSFEPDLPFHTDIQLKNMEDKLNEPAYPLN